MGLVNKSSKSKLIRHKEFEYHRRHRQENIAREIKQITQCDYQKNDFDLFVQGGNWFNNGFSLEEADDNLKINVNFINGFNRAKRISEAEKFLYDLGVQYFIDGFSLEEIPIKYRDNLIVIKGFQEAKSKANIKSLHV